MRSWIRAAALATVVLAGTSGEAAAAPKDGQGFPVFTARDVTGVTQSTASFRGATTIVVAITARGGGDAMRAWFEGAAKRAPSVRLKGIISVGVPFFISEDYARAQARMQIPKAYWHDNLFDAHHVMAKILGLPESDTPFAFVLDAKGVVVAQAHAKAGASAADVVWRSIETPK
jgi:hypothetical protein